MSEEKQATGETPENDGRDVKNKEGKHLPKWAKRLIVVLLSFAVFVSAVLGVLQLGVVYTERSWEHWSPDYEKTDILPILQKESLTEEDYETVYRQTGLTKLGLDGLLESKNYTQVLRIQDYFFEEHKVTSEYFNPFTYLETVDDFATFGALEDGDIIVSATTRVSWFRYGHAALIVDGKNGVLVESTMPGQKSGFNDINSFAYLANFLILRPKADAETKANVVAFAKEKLVGLPYQMTTGILTKKYAAGKAIKTTHCAHLVWSAYRAFGIDLDSNGGLIVKPQDMALSDKVELVQTFGFDPDALWS